MLIFCFSNNIWDCVERGSLYYYFLFSQRKIENEIIETTTMERIFEKKVSFNVK